MIGCKDNGSNDGGGIIIPPMTEPPRLVDIEPDWSQDGKTIAYTHLAQNDSEHQNGLYQIWLLDLTTMTKTFLTAGFDAAWSPDAQRLVFVAVLTDGSAKTFVCIVNIDGTNLKILTPGDSTASTPDW